MNAAARGLVLLAAGAVALAGGGASAQEWPAKAADVSAKYKMTAQLIEKGIDDDYRIKGEQTIFWKNTSNEPVKVLYLHTYVNAFRNTRSTFLREAVRDDFKIPDDMKFGDMPLPRIWVHDDELAPAWFTGESGNPDDRTVLRVELPQAVEQLDSIPIKIDFIAELPHVLRRMGGRHGFVMAAQWFPKLGRYVGLEAAPATEGWYCPPYHANCEFAADFADYDVTLKFPTEFKVGASGVPDAVDLVDEKTGVTTRRYRAESVVDFAWTAGKRFVPFEYDVVPVVPERMDDRVAGEWRRVKALLDLSAEDAALPSVRVVLLLQPEHAAQAERHREAARVALALYGTWLGPYPYPRLTIVDPPWDGKAAGGMEYPTLVTAGTVAESPADSLNPEHVIVHEIGHQWLMNLIASNECEEAWLDEGINTYLTAQALDIAYGELGPPRQYTEMLGRQIPYVPFYTFPGLDKGWPEFFGLPKWAQPADIEIFRPWRDLPHLTWVGAQRYGSDAMLPLRKSYLRRAGWDAMVKPGWKYADRMSYGVNAYARPALFLNTLRRTLAADLGGDEGERRFLRALREYAREQRFRHPVTADFLRKFGEVAADPAAAAEQLIRTAATLDYAVEFIRGESDPDLAGFDEKGVLVKKEKDAKEPPEKPKRTIVRVRRLGQAIVPIPLEVTRKDGTRESVRWAVTDQTKDAWQDFTFDGEVVSARLDPGGIYLQDGDLGNGYLATQANARPAVKWSVRFLDWLENALVGYGRFF